MSLPLRVLIVEDSEDDVLSLLRELRRGDYSPVYQRVDTPQEMEAALAGEPWDIVISDYNMPHFSGPAVRRPCNRCSRASKTCPSSSFPARWARTRRWPP
jgi:response regulator RpfG family c-di-GMP phosphodiesterase